MNTHIHSPLGYYLAQFKPLGCRNWRCIHQSVIKAKAFRSLDRVGRGRVRIIYCDEDGWYEQTIIFEGKWK